MRSIVDNIELWLSGAGVVVILLVPRLLFSQQDRYWTSMAVTALIVGVLHGGIFWLIRRRQRHVRAQAIRELQGMLMDRVNNQLNVILMHLEVDRSADSRASIEGVQAAVTDVSQLLNSLSEESLRSWQRRYATVLTTPHAA